MSFSDRDKKILMFVVPLVLLVGYWFMLLGPQRKEAQQVADKLAKQEQRRDKAEAKVRQLTAAKADFSGQYGRLIKVGKAVPTQVDVPSLIVQLESAARGTDIDFTKIAAGNRDAAGASTASTSSSSSSGGQAASGPGQAAQTAKGAKSNAESANAGRESAANKTGVSSQDTQTSTSSKSGGLPVGGGATGAGGAAAAGCAAGLECVPLDFEFSGGFFDLADFFHRMKRFVKVANERLEVRGRLMTIDGLKFSSDEELFPALTAEVKATVYLSPKTEGATAGASPQGPSQTTPASSSGGSTASSTSTPTPTATATP